MIRSMTGYGKGRAAQGDLVLTAEVRSVNGRGREVRVKLPQELNALESSLREQVQAAVARGRVEVGIRWESGSLAAGRYQVNFAQAETLMAAWHQLRERFFLTGEPTPTDLLRLPGVVEMSGGHEFDVETLAPVVSGALAAALDEHRQTREREGQQLAADLRARAQVIVAAVDEIKPRVAAAPERWAAQLRQRVTALLAEIPIDEARLAQEVAIAAQKADVTEELVRLDAHLARLMALFAPGMQEIGQTIDFLVQEIRREVNTLTVKAGDPEVDERALRIKSELERLREQAANLE